MSAELGFHLEVSHTAGGSLSLPLRKRDARASSRAANRWFLFSICPLMIPTCTHLRASQGLTALQDRHLNGGGPFLGQGPGLLSLMARVCCAGAPHCAAHLAFGNETGSLNALADQKCPVLRICASLLSTKAI